MLCLKLELFTITVFSILHFTGSYKKTAILGREIALPCYVEPKDSEDFVTLVLWYKGFTDVPLYSYDSRAELSDAEAQHHASERVGHRAFFNVNTEPASLQIKNVQESDEGIYRCRVDFFHSRTLTYTVKLTVIGRCFMISLLFLL